MIDAMSRALNWDTVLGWFQVLNDLSVVYVIIPFFFVELIRYAFLKRLNLDVIGDSVANVVTFICFVAIEYALGILFVTKLYFWIYENFSLAHLSLNWVTIVTCVLLADLTYYWDHRMMHRIGVGWATHTVHHSSPHFNMSVAYRFGPLHAVFPHVRDLRTGDRAGDVRDRPADQLEQPLYRVPARDWAHDREDRSDEGRLEPAEGAGETAGLECVGWE